MMRYELWGKGNDAGELFEDEGDLFLGRLETAEWREPESMRKTGCYLRGKDGSRRWMGGGWVFPGGEQRFAAVAGQEEPAEGTKDVAAANEVNRAQIEQERKFCTAYGAREAVEDVLELAKRSAGAWKRGGWHREAAALRRFVLLVEQRLEAAKLVEEDLKQGAEATKR